MCNEVNKQEGIYHRVRRRKMTKGIYGSELNHVICNDIFDSRVPDMANGEHNGRGRCCDRSKVSCESKNGPTIFDSSKVSILGIQKVSVVDKLRPSNYVGCSLVGGVHRLRTNKSRVCRDKTSLLTFMIE